MEIKECPLKREDCKCDDFSIVSNVIREGDGTILNCPRCDFLTQRADLEEFSAIYSR